VHIFSDSGELRSDLLLGEEAADQLYDESIESRPRTWVASFSFKPSPDGTPWAGGGVTSVHLIDDETLGAKLERHISRKAAKRSKLPAKHRNTPFVVALQSDEGELAPGTVLSCLTGARTWLRGPHEMPSVPRFVDACRAGWAPLLAAWDYVGTTSVDFRAGHGAFGDPSPSGWGQQISGVLVTHQTWTLQQWLPNPFAATPILDRRLLDIGLPFAVGEL
jgi:hypothetical protein